MSGPPLPVRERWQPLRLGLVNLFHYDDETFVFRDGRLLLRGNNGTGKSKVLALTLPFLLDGRLAPARVEPDGDPNKRMDWNLLLGGRYSERLGYAWIEFGRLDEAGGGEVLTAGCGLKAVAGRPVQSWFFTVPLRVGEGLQLIDSHDRPLSRERLKEALEGQGEVYDAAARYRRALDERLFHLGAQRYEALIELLIQLRQPQLSKRPDERALSRALTEALPPLSQSVLADVAEAFRNLDAERDELDALQEARTAVEAFLDHYRRYACIAARRRGERLRRAQSLYEKTSAELGHARDALQRDLGAERGLRQAEAEQQERLRGARTQAETLRASEAMRDARELQRAEEDADKEATREEGAAAEERRLREELNHRGERLRRQQGRTDASAGRLGGVRAEAEQAAEAAGLAADHAGILRPLELPRGPEAGPDEALLSDAEARARALAGRRRDALVHLQGLLRRVDEAERGHRDARGAWQREVDEGRRLDDERAEAEQAAARAGEALVEGFRAYARGLEVLVLDDPEVLAAELADWTQTLEGPDPAVGALDEAYRLGLRRIEEERAAARARRREAEREREDWEGERRRLEAGEHSRPPRPWHRDESTRAGRPGAPLWELVDFRPGVDADTAAALEAALEASGLLDAWVLPEGRVLDPGTWDTVLVPGTARTQNLNAVLVPAVDPEDPRASAVERGVLEGVLAAVAWGEAQAPAWVAADGRWRLGPARGAWTKDRARYLGRGAREAARRQRLAELTQWIERQDGLIAGLDAELQALDGRAEAAGAERSALPGDADLRRAHDRVGDLTARRRERQERIEHAERALAGARARLRERTDARDEAAADLSLPADAESLARLLEGVGDYAAAERALWPAVREHWSDRTALAEAARELAGAHERLDAQRDRLETARRAAQTAAVRRDTLRATVGEAAEAVLARLAEAEGRIDDAEQALERNRAEQIDQARRIQGLRSDIAHLEGQRREQGRGRDEAVAALEAFAAEGLLRAALPELEPPAQRPWAADPAVRLARRMEEALAEVDHSDPAWERHQRGLMEHVTALQNALSRHGHQASAEPVGELMLVRVVFQARAQGADELAENLRREVDERRALLDAREQEVLENYLIDEVASHLQERVSGAERRVAAMNAELERRPTSTGMRLRLQWRPLEEGSEAAGMNAPGGLAEIRRRLRQLAEAWTPADREAVGRFLKQRIDEARAGSEGGSLVEILERALDYRHWYRFVVERWQDGRWRPAYGPASGGERALVVTIPLFAAASSHYASAAARSPRLIMLDEAFAGIDDDSRGKCMGLLAQFDLDFVMTSEREWGCYPDLPGLAIAQLVRREDLDAVFVSHWSWDGRRRHRGPEPPAGEPAPGAGPAEGLFG